jgi:hypothetical protein
VAAAVFLGWGYIDRVDADKANWDRAAQLESRFLDDLHRIVPRPPSGSTVYALGSPGYPAPGVPAFVSDWDLNGAIKISYDDGSLSAYPLLAGSGVTLACAADGVFPQGGSYGRGQLAPYGKALVVDVRSGVTRSITSARACPREVAGLTP